jgi:BMFP domain-containing protein YqiC
MQVNSRLLDDLARLRPGALGAAAGMKGEVETLVRERLRRLLDEADLVSREEFEAVKAMAAKARAEQEALAARLAGLEARLAAAGNDTGDTPVQEGSGRRTTAGSGLDR